MAEESTGATTGQDAGAEQGIAGTNFKSQEELAAAYIKESDQRANLEKKLGEQGSELGTLRKVVESLATQQKAAPAEPVKPAGPDYDAEIAGVEKQLEDIDPMADDFPKKQRELISKLTKLTAKAQHEKTLNAAGELMKKELSTRDAQAQTKAFHEANPTFSTPEMQMRIKDFLANDKSGMHDALSAFREIERDDIAQEASLLKQQNEEMRQRLELAKGKEETGKVIVKGQSPAAVTKPGKVTGKDLDAGMLAALRAAKGA